MPFFSFEFGGAHLSMFEPRSFYSVLRLLVLDALSSQVVSGQFNRRKHQTVQDQRHEISSKEYLSVDAIRMMGGDMRFYRMMSIALISCVVVGSLPQLAPTVVKGGSVIWSGHIDVDTSWEAIDSPFWVKGIVTIDYGSTLTIENDVTVKFELGGGLFVEGSLKINGSQGHTVEITSNRSSPQPGDWLGIQVNRTGTVYISDCMLEYAINGIYVKKSNNNTIQRSEFMNGLNGLRFESSMNNTISNSSMVSNQIGLKAESMSNSSVTNTRTHKNDRGLELIECTNNSLENITSSKNSLDGVYLASSDNNTILGGMMSANGRFGLFLDRVVGKSISTNNTIVGLNITSNVEGVHIQDSSFNAIQENNITNNICGIFTVEPSSNNVIARNSILGNIQYAILSSSRNVADSNYFGTTNPEQLLKMIGGGILTQNPSSFRESEVEKIEGDVTWTEVALSKSGILVDGNLTLDRVSVNFSSESNSNFIQVAGSLEIRNSEFRTMNGNFSIVFLNRSKGYLIDSVFEGQMGIGIHTDSGISISNSTMRNGMMGILTHKSSNGTVDSLTVSNSMTGIAFSETRDFSVNNSVLKCNQGSGISFFLSSDVTIAHSNISSNGMRGIYLSLSNSNLILKNNISFNAETGIFLKDSYDNLIFNNNFVSNLLQAYDDDNLSAYDKGYPIGGNYWSNYGGSDSYNGPNQDIPGGDGIVDTPYLIPISSWDRYPLKSPYFEAGNRSWSDVIPPARITDLVVSGTNASSVTLTWIAPGDDGYSGFASSYDIRHSTNEITNATWDSDLKFDSNLIPGPPGSMELIVVTGLQESQHYYFAVKTSDEVPNWADLSNIASGQTTDVSPPIVEELIISPRPQEVLGQVNITARIVDNTEVAIQRINISSPSYRSVNTTMIRLSDDWFFINSSYDELGVYHLIIWVCDSSSNCNSLADMFEMVDLVPPNALAGGNIAIEVGESFLLDASDSTDNYGIMNYTWRIRVHEDDLQLFGQVLHHTFYECGTFNVTLVVTDWAGNQGQDWILVTVTEDSLPGDPSIIWWVVLSIAIVFGVAIILFFAKRQRDKKMEEEEKID